MSNESEREIQRFKQMYTDGDVSLDVFEAMVEYYHEEEGGSGPSVLGMSIPSSVDADAPPVDPFEHPGIKEKLND